MTTIRASEYSPNSPAQRLSPLKPGQVALLNSGAAKDISERVKTVVQHHLDYQGTDVFRTTFTKKEITFSLTNGPVTENRTLKLINGRWMLSKNNTPATHLTRADEGEVNTLINDILASIGQASRANVSDRVQTNPTVAVDAGVSSANADELAQIKDRLTALESQLRTNLTLEQSLEVQRQILEELIGLRGALQKQSHTNHAEKDELLKQVAKLQKNLAKKDKELQALTKAAEVQLKCLQVGFDDEKKKFQEALKEKNKEALELQQQVAGLKKALSEKEAEQKRSLEAIESFKAEKASLEKQLQNAQENLGTTKSQLEELQKAYNALLAKNEEREAEFDNLTQKNEALLAEIQNLKKTVEALENENSSLREEIELTKKVFAENIAQMKSLSEQLEMAAQTQNTLQTRNIDLDSKLQQAEFTNGIFDLTVNGLKELLHEKEQQLKAALEKKEEERRNLATAYSESNIKTRAAFAQKTDELERTRLELEEAKTAAQKVQESELQTQNELKNVKELFLETQGKVEKLQTIFDKKETEEAELRKAFEAAKFSNDEKERIAKQWQDEALLLAIGVNDFKDKIAGLQAETAKLNRQFDYQNLIINEGSLLEEKLKTAQSDLGIKTQQLEKLQTELQRIQATAEILGKENNTLKDKNTSAEKVIATNATQISYLKEQLTTSTRLEEAILQSQINELQADLDKAKQIATETKEELTKAKENNTELTDQVESANKLNILALEHIQTLEKALNEKDQHLEAAAKNIMQIESQLVTATQMQELLQNKIEGYKSDRATAEQLSEEATSALREAEAKISQLQTELEELDTLLEEQEIELGAIQSEKKDLIGQLEAEKMFKELAQELNTNFEKSLDEKDQQLKVAAENTAQMKSQLEQTIQNLQASLEEKEEQLESTRLDLEEANLDLKNAESNAGFAAREAKNTQSQTLNELQKVNEAFQEAQRKVNDLEEKLSRLTTAHDQAQLELKNLEQQAQKAKQLQGWNPGGWDSCTS
jgi:chromosome segregation ATPase